MKASTIPVICSCALTAMSAAGLSHWWSVRQFITAMDVGIPTVSPRHAPQPAAAPREAPLKAPDLLAANPTPQATAVTTAQKAFYEALIAKMEGIQNQNRDLLDQLAETNRDLMKLEFRVDTHSESFRPMPVSEDRPYTSVDDEPGVLPPRAEPVVFPNPE
jgi:hypothetical protein